jgi:hypothetical protein
MATFGRKIGPELQLFRNNDIDHVRDDDRGPERSWASAAGPCPAAAALQNATHPDSPMGRYLGDQCLLRWLESQR